jgi:hypothetical protein
MNDLAGSEQKPTDAERSAMIEAARQIMSLQKYCALVTMGPSG